jgi:anti-sigma-K factor RskA
MSTPSAGCGSDVAAYALGALTDEETQRFEAHLRTCELCRADLAQLTPVVDVLPGAAEPVAPPPELRDRIMRVVEGEARERARASRRAERKRRFGLLSAVRPMPALAAACAVLLAGIAVGVFAGGGDDGKTYQGMFLRSSGTVEMQVSGDGRATLKIEGMGQAPPRRVYQVWTQRIGEAPRATDALFTVDRDGSASVSVPGDLDEVDQVLVTDEPPGGSAAPTTAPYFAVRMA